ncbi:Inositol-1,4,5-trisphosphate 5-phosphatase 1 [Nosema granulosis]|uniref:Inositol-1,4,5-trisphosphate 5-phosphatase 1 n=1 Tax=Nosema granulosis TaxID=83296 RepID=A0A9P6H1J4_9MICR|nr:Inositol-1,4,5-trisphosphate 5-phosphatase 1 [Nosema granulosis]
MFTIFNYKYSGKMFWETEKGKVSLASRHNIEFMDEEPEIYEAEFVLGVIEIDDNSYLGIVKKSESLGLYEGNEVFKIKKVDFIPLVVCPQSDHTIYVKQLIQSYDFYVCKSMFMKERFIWNMHMIDRLKYGGEEWKCIPKDTIDSDCGLVYMFCGFFVSKSFKVFEGFYNIKLLSLVCTRKMGTRLLSRGLDKDGNVSFFVKTHCSIRRNNKVVFDFNILRGSVPLFWGQKTQGINGRLYFFGEEDDLNEAFDKHFESLEEEFGNIHVVTLLGHRKDEKVLSSTYINMLKEKNIPYTDFDFNSHTNDFDNLKVLFSYKLEEAKKDVVYRVNCVDCLDRTNLAQYLICKYNVEKTLKKNYTVEKILQECWTENGHSLSNLYTGSDVMKSELSLKQKRSLFGLVDDFLISATRLINNRFTDKQKNKIINILLGRETGEETSQNIDIS